MVDVFISYASEDRDRVAPLVEAIEAEGLEVWWDQHIHAGPSFRAAIEDAMASCRCMLVIWSTASVESDFVIDEATTGRERGILVPVQLDDAQIPLGFRAAQTAQLQRWPDDRDGLEQLLAGIQDTLSGRSSPARTPTPSSTRRWALPAVLSAALLLAVAYFSLTPTEDPYVEQSIAVLPLKNTSGASEASFLVEGLHEALIANLSKLSSLRVTSPTSVRRVDKGLPVSEIGAVLGVANIIEGSVLREGNQVRIIVQLVNAATAENIWSETYDRTVDNILALQAEITRAIADQISVQLSPDDESRINAVEAMNPATYETYLRGMYELRKETLRGYRSGIRIMREALEKDPDSAMASAGVAIGYSMLGHNFFPETALPKAREAALKALALDDSLPEVHLAMGMYKMYFEWDWQEADEYLRRALEINPSLVDAHYHYSWLLELFDDKEKALYHGEKTKQLNPLSPFYNGWLADQYRGLGRYDDAIRQAEYTISLNESYPLGWFALGNTYADQGEFEKAIEAHEKLKDRYFWSWALGGTYAKAGRVEDAMQVYNAIEPEEDNAIPLTLIAAAIGDEQSMYRWLEAARDNRISWYPWLVAWFPATQPYRNQPEMQSLIEALNLDSQSLTVPAI